MLAMSSESRFTQLATTIGCATLATSAAPIMRSKGKKRADPLKNLRREMAQPPGAPEGAENAVPAPQPPKKKKAKAPKKAAAAKEEEL